MRKIIICGLFLGTLLAAGSAKAKDMSGRFGLGGEATLAGAPNATATTVSRPAGLNAIYWIGNLGIEGLLHMDVVAPAHADSAFGFGVTLGAIYNVARAVETNFGLGGRFGVSVIDPGAGKTRAYFDIELPVRVEHFFGDAFSIHGEVGLAILVDSDGDANMGLNTGLLGGAGFNYYF